MGDLVQTEKPKDSFGQPPDPDFWSLRQTRGPSKTLVPAPGFDHM